MFVNDVKHKNVFLWKKIDAIIGNGSLNIPVVFLVYMFSLMNFL